MKPAARGAAGKRGVPKEPGSLSLLLEATSEFCSSLGVLKALVKGTPTCLWGSSLPATRHRCGKHCAGHQKPAGHDEINASALSRLKWAPEQKWWAGGRLGEMHNTPRSPKSACSGQRHC